jgi:hypothetical protein
MNIEQEKTLAAYFISGMGELVSRTRRKGYTLGLEYKDIRKVILTAIKVMHILAEDFPKEG